MVRLIVVILGMGFLFGCGGGDLPTSKDMSAPDMPPDVTHEKETILELVEEEIPVEKEVIDEEIQSGDGNLPTSKDMSAPDMPPDVTDEKETILELVEDEIPIEKEVIDEEIQSECESPGCPWTECNDNADCLSGFCIETQKGKQCTVLCNENKSCPEGFECGQVATKPDIVYACIQPAPKRCLPCKNDDDCNSLYSSVPLSCVALNGFSFCVLRCNNKGCLADEVCVEIEGDNICLPQGQDTCKCTGLGDGKDGACEIKNDIGICIGSFSCKEGQITSCEGKQAENEVCNNIDDDCDGDVDEDIEGGSCDLINEFGTCKGIEICVGGKMLCQGAYATSEICNSKDDDCDGDTDEGFPDMDGDGEADCVDQDKDGDSINDGQDNCPAVANPDQEDTDNDKEGDACDKDDDDDGIPDTTDNCPKLINLGQEDLDKDGIGDLCDCDIDNDGFANNNPGCPLIEIEDGCPFIPDPPQISDTDGDGIWDTCDCDIDGDGVGNNAPNCPILDKTDNCPKMENSGQEDADKDGIGDVCDDDDDNDGVIDVSDLCPMVYDPNQIDTDQDNIGDLCDPDIDGDGIMNEGDNCPNTVNPLQEDNNGNGIGDICEEDWDSDGIVNVEDNCPWYANKDQQDIDNDNIGDACDCDIDGDGIGNLGMDCPKPDNVDNCPIVSNPDQSDLDEDNIGDVCDQDIDGDGDPNENDCSPLDPKVGHTKIELCNGKDDNCDGNIDEENAIGCELFYLDEDNDGWGTAKSRCLCSPEGSYNALKKGDCDDGDPQKNPGQEEKCNGKDDDCDLNIDEEGANGCKVYYKDVDGDGFGNPQKPPKCLCEPDPANDYTALEGNDCNDIDPTISPAAAELCNGKDDNCDGSVDEDLGQTTCGKGICVHTVDNCKDGKPQQCDPMEGAKEEVCNGLDDDCDGSVDEDLGQTTCGKGICVHTIDNCKDGKPQQCDPMEGAKEEVCNGLDDDCDGSVDEDLGQTTCGKGICVHTIDNCKDGKPQQCDPMEGAKEEVCNGLDDDCDGSIDNGLDTPGSCNDGDQCTYGDKCVNGNCEGTPYSCNDNNPCTIDKCLGDGKCQYVFDQTACASIGCADGMRDVFADKNKYPTVAGCAGKWANKDLRAQRSGTIGCGSISNPCPSAEDLCAPGWHICLRSGMASELNSKITATECQTAGDGIYLTAASHCASSSSCDYSQPYPCWSAGWCSESVCCGTGCGYGACTGGVWQSGTPIFQGTQHGCSNSSAIDWPQITGILCCKD